MPEAFAKRFNPEFVASQCSIITSDPLQMKTSAKSRSGIEVPILNDSELSRRQVLYLEA